MLSVNSLNDLPLDIKIIIAQNASLQMYLFDDEFRSWANTPGRIIIHEYLSYSIHCLMDIKLENYHDGWKCWYSNNIRHREQGPAVIGPDTEEYWYNGMLHRLDGPAIINNDCTAYYQNDELHRLDGPALMYPGGDMHWYHHGEYIRTDHSLWKKILSYI
jgi:hypothetical protein